MNDKIKYLREEVDKIQGRLNQVFLILIDLEDSLKEGDCANNGN